MTTTNRSLSRRRVAAAPRKTGGKKINAGRVAAWTAMIILILITLFPFYWMIRTAFSTSQSLFSDPNSLLPVDFTLGAFKRVLGLATPAEAQAEGGSGAAVNFWLFLRNSIDLRHAVDGWAGVLQRAGGLRVRPAPLARTEQGVRPVPGRADGPADLHQPAELHHDQEPRTAQHLPGLDPAVLLHDTVRDLLPAAVLPRHQQGNRGGGQARRRRALADLLPDHPADELGAHHHACSS